MSILRKSAKGRECMVRIPGVCNFNPNSTVLAHLNTGGMGQKASDLHGAWCCSSCHDVIDGRSECFKDSWAECLVDSSMGPRVRYRPFNALEIKAFHLEGVIRTQEAWLKEGLIEI